MSAYDDLMHNMAALAVRMDVLGAQQTQMSAMRTQSSRLHRLLRCAPTAQALAADLVQALGSAAGARSYLQELRTECADTFDALVDEVDRIDPPTTDTYEGRYD